jgi:hypothetical protein
MSCCLSLPQFYGGAAQDFGSARPLWESYGWSLFKLQDPPAESNLDHVKIQVQGTTQKALGECGSVSTLAALPMYAACAKVSTLWRPCRPMLLYCSAFNESMASTATCWHSSSAAQVKANLHCELVWATHGTLQHACTHCPHACTQFALSSDKLAYGMHLQLVTTQQTMSMALTYHSIPLLVRACRVSLCTS